MANTTTPAASHTAPASANGRKVEMAAVNILTADLLLVDERLSIPSAQELQTLSPKQRDQYARLENFIVKLLANKGMQRGEKISIEANDFRTLSVLMAGLPAKMEPGGATADVLTTMKHLHGDKMHADFIGIAGYDGIGDQLITDDIRKSGIALQPGPMADGKAATSFIFTHADGKRSIITYAGNAAEKLHADAITNAHLAKNDTVFLPISLWSKFEESFPETLLQKSVAHDKNIILSIPKQARFGYEGAEDIHKRLIPQADVIVADEAELARWYKTGTDIERAISLLQVDIAQRDTTRAAAGKAPRNKPVSAFIKHKDDSATVLVAQSPPGVSPLVPAARYEIAPPPQVAPEKHTLGVDDAMYAGFITALQCGMTPDKAGEYAMEVGQTKFLYDSVRIPSPIGADKATQKQWHNLRSGLDDALAEIGSAISYAKTGVSNPHANVNRTLGQKIFDIGLYPLLANFGVFALSTYVTYHSGFNQNKANWFVKRSSWFKDQLSKSPVLAENPEMVRNLNMVIWSFIDGSLLSPVVAAFESKRQSISRWIDDKMGTTAEDKTVYDKEVQRSWSDVLKARAATFALVIGTYFALNTKVFPKGVGEGILNETKTSGVFTRSPVTSVNGLIFDIPGKKIGGWLTDIPFIRNFAQKISGKQLKGMAEKTGTTVRAATEADARYQVEGMVNTGLFELVYTSLCTAGLFFLGKSFASKRKDNELKEDKAKAQAEHFPLAATDSTPQDASRAWTEKVAPKLTIEQHASYLDAVDKSRSHSMQLST
jgi:sugar/nucleoside kinase (ribokinase family)